MRRYKTGIASLAIDGFLPNQIVERGKSMHHCRMKIMMSVAALTVANSVLAQSYPTRAIKILTTGAGGGADVAARILAPEMTNQIGQPVVIETRPAGLGVGLAIAKTAPDGYTIMMGPGATW